MVITIVDKNTAAGVRQSWQKSSSLWSHCERGHPVLDIVKGKSENFSAIMPLYTVTDCVLTSKWPNVSRSVCNVGCG